MPHHFTTKWNFFQQQICRIVRVVAGGASTAQLLGSAARSGPQSPRIASPLQTFREKRRMSAMVSEIHPLEDKRTACANYQEIPQQLDIVSEIRFID